MRKRREYREKMWGGGRRERFGESERREEVEMKKMVDRSRSWVRSGRKG